MLVRFSVGKISKFGRIRSPDEQGRLPNLNRWLRPYNVQEISCGQCGSTVPSANTVEASTSGRSLLDSAIIYDNLTIICKVCECSLNRESPQPMVSSVSPAISSAPTPITSITNPSSSWAHPLHGFSPDVLSQLASAQMSQLSQLGLPPLYPLIPQLLSAYQNPANLAGLSHAQLTAAALSQQMATSQFVGQKRPKEEDSTIEAKKEKTSNITERIRQLEEKYEKLQNSSRKLAESVVSGEFSKDEAKSLLTKMEE